MLNDGCAHACSIVDGIPLWDKSPKGLKYKRISVTAAYKNCIDLLYIRSLKVKNLHQKELHQNKQKK